MRRIFFISVILLLLISSTVVIYRAIPYTESVWVCAFTGSRKGNEQWFYSLETNQYLIISPLAKRFHNDGITFKYRWQCITHNEQTLFKKTYGSSRAPEIYFFPHKFQVAFANHATHKEVLQLATALQKDPCIYQKEQQQAVSTAIDIAFGYSEK